MNKALFLDRDGVINEDRHYVHKIEDFVFLDGVFDALKTAQNFGYLLIIVTNQAGIGRGYYTESDFDKLTSWMVSEFMRREVEITKVYYCPTHPEAEIQKFRGESFMRKPNPGMILQAQQDFQIDLSRSILVGDKETDIEAGRTAGVSTNILLNHSQNCSPKTNTDFVITNLCQLKTIINTI